MAIRLIAIDLDGTTLTQGRIPHPDTAEAVRKATELGICVVPASGRLSTTMWPHIKRIGTTGPMICCNGAVVLGMDREVIHSSSVPNVALEIVAQYAQEHNVHVSVYTLTEMHFLSNTSYGQLYLSRTKELAPRVVPVAELEKQALFKIILVDAPEEIPCHREKLTELLKDANICMTESEPEYLEILASDVSKGAALQFLANHLSIQQSETAAIGDYLNDMEMVKWASVGAAVKNAHPDLQAVADLIAPSNDDGGVAWFIDYICTNRQE